MEKFYEIMEKDLLEMDVSLTEIIVQEDSEGIDRLFKDYMETQSKIEELICDSHYIEWLDQFTKKHGNIDDDSWMAYRSNIIEDDDKKLIDNLYYFYIGIRQYATLINIESRGYYIMFNDFCFHIDRYPDGNHTKTSVWRYKHFKSEDYLDKRFHIIDFNEIISNFRQYKSTQVSKQLCILSSLAKAIHKNGVPVETIVGTVDTEFSKNKKQKEIVKEAQECIKTLKLKK